MSGELSANLSEADHVKMERRRIVTKERFNELIDYSDSLRKKFAWIGWPVGVATYAIWWGLEKLLAAKGEASDFEFHTVFLGVVALFTAGLLVILMVRILASVENTSAEKGFEVSLSEWSEPTKEGLEFERSKIYRYQWLGYGIAAVLSFLFIANQTVWDSVVMDKWALTMSLMLAPFGASAVFRVMRRELRRRAELQDELGEKAQERWSRPRITSFEKAFAIVGIVFALYSGKLATITLTRSARANVAASRGQLYQTEARLTEREGQNMDLGGLYIRVGIKAAEADIVDCNRKFWQDRARDYWRDRLVATLEPLEREMTGTIYRNPVLEAELGKVSLHPSDGPPSLAEWKEVRARVHERITDLVDGRCGNVAALYDFIYCDDSAILSQESHVERRCRDCLATMLTHIVDILDLMHAAFDYRDEQILRANEFETWVGYIRDVGAHPMLLVVTKNWLEQRYFSKEFFSELNNRFLMAERDTDNSKDKVRVFVEKVVWDKYLREDLGDSYFELVRGLRTYRTMNFQRVQVPSRPDVPTKANTPSLHVKP